MSGRNRQRARHSVGRERQVVCQACLVTVVIVVDIVVIVGFRAVVVAAFAVTVTVVMAVRCV